MQTVLAVDNNQKNLIQIENILTTDYIVVGVNSWGMAVKFLGQRSPDLILLGDTDKLAVDGKNEPCMELQSNEEWKDIPVGFIPRDIDAEQLRREVRDIIFSGLDSDKEYLPVISNGNIGEILVDKIHYIEIYNQIRIVKLQYQELQTRMTTEHLIRRLGNRFLKIGDSLLVNKAFIHRVEDGVLFMKDGRQLVLPKESRQDIVDQIKLALAVNND